MSLRIVMVLAVFIAVGTTPLPAPAQDGPVSAFLHSIPRDWKRRNCWPEPFVCPDRQAVREPLAIMVNRGWERQNMLADQYFEDNRAELTEAGKLKIQWVLTEPPPHHRTLYVHRALSPELTQARIESVRAYALLLLQGEPCPQILETTVSQPGWPADRVDALSRKFQAAMPEPKLPSASSGAGGESP